MATFSWLGGEMEEWAFQETLRMNERGLPVDIPLARKTKRFLTEYNDRRIQECLDITGGIVPTRVAELLGWLRTNGARVSNLQRIHLERALAEQELSAEVREVINIRLEQGRVSTKKLDSMLLLGAEDGVVRGSFIYHGAGTGRFTARRLQPHNFQRPTIKDVDWVIQCLEVDHFDAIVEKYGDRTLEAIGSCMRAFFKAPTGQLIVRADYNAIEARVLSWCAGQVDAVLSFHNGDDSYCDMAGYIFDIPAEEIEAGHKAEVIEFSEMRKLGKDTVLGCGYSMWIATFLCQMENKGSESIAGIPLRDNIAMRGQRDEESFNPEAWDMGKKAVIAYRDKYDRVVKFWHGLERALLLAEERPGTIYRYRYIAFRKEGHYMIMRLPSGRKIHYPYITVEPGTDWYGRPKSEITYKVVNAKGLWVTEKLYGGKIVENAVQAIARDLMVYGMRCAADAGFALVGTVHDEIISLHPKVRRRKKLARDFEQIICQMPPWATGDSLETTVPLTAEGVVSERYGK